METGPCAAFLLWVAEEKARGHVSVSSVNEEALGTFVQETPISTDGRYQL
ncbi:hypothetical protein ACIOZM_07260 [Pseudomonas sp. NPDC087346]